MAKDNKHDYSSIFNKSTISYVVDAAEFYQVGNYLIDETRVLG